MYKDRERERSKALNKGHSERFNILFGREDGFGGSFLETGIPYDH